jgi:flagellar secretion chaperone FliS
MERKMRCISIASSATAPQRQDAMSMNNPYDTYLESQLTTATPGKLVVMTFDAAIKFARTAVEAMKVHDLYQQSANIGKTQKLLSELTSVLDMKTDAELAGSLFKLYSFMFDRLTRANIDDDQAVLQEVIGMLCELRQTWAEAEMMVRTGQLVAVPMEAVAA